jgi:hypothetical protein
MVRREALAAFPLATPAMAETLLRITGSLAVRRCATNWQPSREVVAAHNDGKHIPRGGFADNPYQFLIDL